MHAMAKIAKHRQPLTNFELEAKSVPLESRLAILTKSPEGWWYPRNVANIQIGCEKWPLQIIKLKTPL